MSTARLTLDRTITEKDWQQTVIAYARYNGYLVYHTHDSRKSEPGFPDLTFVKNAGPGDLFFAEIKGPYGRITPAQQHWIDRINTAGTDAYLWRPVDWPQVEQRLRKHRP